MKYRWSSFLVAFAIALAYEDEESSDSTALEYINRQLRDIKVDLAKSHSQDDLSPDRVYDVRWTRLWDENVNLDNPLALNLSNETFFLVKERVLRVGVDLSKKVTLHQVALIEEQKPATFVRTVSWKESLHLLICREDGSCNLYVGPNTNDLRYQQVLKSEGRPMDAQFFVQFDQLYLVVAKNSGQFSVSSMIYRWTGTYMDETAPVTTTGAVSVTTFNHKQSTVIIFAQNVKEKPKIGSGVFKFSNGAVEKIQYLDTDRPVSIHHYEYEEKTFLLVINEINESKVFWWEGKEFLDWMKLPELSSTTKVDVVYVNEDTLLLVAQQNTLSVYRIMNLDYTKLKLLELEERYVITDFNVRVKGSSIIVLLVTRFDGGLCRVEPMEITIVKSVKVKQPEKADLTWQSLRDLDNLLKNRMPAIEEAFELWPKLLPYDENIFVASPLEFEGLLLESGSISKIVVSTPEEILTPTELNVGLEKINLAADDLISESSELLFPNEISEISETLVVQGDAFFDEFHVDSLNVDYLNNEKVEFDRVFSYTKDQDFDDPLKGNLITIHNLEVDSLCGIPFENWQMVSDDLKTGLDFLAENVELLNNTIFVQSDLTLNNLGVSRLNNLDVNDFVDDLFIVGLNQEINGTIFFKKGLNAYDLTINSTNGINAEELLTKTTDQKLGDVVIKTLKVDDLLVEKINDVSVNDAARISKENFVTGQVTFRDLRITEELLVEGVSVHFDIRPLQLYSTVKIIGDLFVKKLDLISGSSTSLNGSKIELNSLFENYWTKSTEQMIKNDVTLTGGITIDDLNVEYLNGYRDEDFLYTTVEEIPDKFGKLNFKSFEIDGFLSGDEGSRPAVSVVDSEDNLIVNQKIQIKSLKVVDLNADSYNKIPASEITSGRIGVNVSGDTKYETLMVGNEMNVDELRVKYFNERDLTNYFEEALVVDENLDLDYLELENLQTENFVVENLGGLKMADFYRMLRYKDVTAVKNITVEGDLLINGNLEVDYINGLTSSDFVNKLSYGDIKLTGRERIDRFIVYENLIAEGLLRDIKIEDLVANTLSKSKQQRITGYYSFEKVHTNSLKVRMINGIDVTYPKLVTDPIFIDGDIIFSDLLVKGDIITGYFNGQDIAEVYANALQIPVTRIVNLTVYGDIFWENPSLDSNSLSYLLRNAVTKNTDQTIIGEVKFSVDVCAYNLKSGKKIGDVDILSIVSDAVVPVGQQIEILGRKYFAKGFIARELKVLGNIGIRNISGSDIVELNSTIVRKYDTETISGNTIFGKNVTIDKLEVSGKVHGLGTEPIATSNRTLPANTKFKNLHIRNQLNVNKLDGIDFNEFVRNRVTIDGDHEIYGDVVFRDPVVVTQNAVLSSVNGVLVADVLLTGFENPQVISGEKTFLSNFSIRGNLIVDFFNDMNLTSEYQNGLLNNKEVHIDGNLIFSSDFETERDVFLTGLVNGIELNKFSINLTREDLTRIESLARKQYSIDKMIDRSLNYTKKLSQVFFYLDKQSELVIKAPNIRKVETISVESMTKINLYGMEKGRYCGLPDFCTCRTQYVAELLENECKVWKVNGSTITHNIHDYNNRYGVNIVSNSTSSGILCTPDNPEPEVTSISWIIPKITSSGKILGKISNNSLEIGGYLSDVKTFTIGAKLYVVLAIYYDSALKSHHVDSLVYEIDLVNGEIKLSQKISTSGAVALDVFATKLHGMHLIIACELDPSESQLHRFNMTNSKFELLRSFRTGGSSNVKSMIQNEESFIFLDDHFANSVNIFNYNKEYDNYHFYQSLYHSSTVKHIEIFYAGEFGTSDAFVIVTTDEGRFFVYEYMFFGGFQLRSQQWLDGVQTMAAFHYSNRRYIFAGTIANSTVYRIVEQGPKYS